MGEKSITNCCHGHLGIGNRKMITNVCLGHLGKGKDYKFSKLSNLNMSRAMEREHWRNCVGGW